MITDKQKRYLPLKRTIDVVLSGGAIVVLSPVLGLLALAIKLDSKGPVLFKQKRVGKNKEFFEIYKFRTMRTDTPSDMPTNMLKDPDQFITKTGKFLRKTSLDELPQIFNIFTGKMSVIGPRPALWNQDDLIAERDKYHANDVTPGLTGWAQINGRDELEIDVKAKFDGDYVNDMGLKMDIKCFLATIGSVLLHDGVVEGGTGELEETVDTQIIDPEKIEKEAKIGAAVVTSAGAVGLTGLGLIYKHCKKDKKKEKKSHKGVHFSLITLLITICLMIAKIFSDKKKVENEVKNIEQNDLHKLENINGKKILFFSPAFFGYENKIKDKMESLGAKVDMYDVRSVSSSYERALLKISPKIFENKSNEYYKQILKENVNKNYDYILIVKCDMTPIKILKDMRILYPNAKLCLYLWDSIENIPGVLNKFKYFDSLHSFDLNDCKKYPILQFRPLFYCDEYKKELNNEIDFKYGISFLGTIHSDRYKVIKEVDEYCSRNNYKTYWFKYLQNRTVYKIYKSLKKEFKNTTEKDFDFDKMSSNEIADVVEQSKIILDIQHPKQTGLTMRTIEMIGMNKKIMTTNETIKEYDFYNPNNIFVIDRNNIKLDTDFFDKQYVPIQKETYEKYSLEQWIKDVLS